MTLNRFLTFDAYVKQGPLTEQIFRLDEAPVPDISEGQMLLQSLAFSLDPFQRTLLQGGQGYFLPYHVPGRPIGGPGVARVVKSRNPAYAEGSIVSGWLDWADWTVSQQEANLVGFNAVNPAWGKLSHALHLYGITGLTAYFGIIEVGEVRAGQDVLVSSAAGAVGTVAGQIAKIRGARVIGLTSTDAKRDMLTHRLGFDAALDHRDPDLARKLLELMPTGPDVYFDNVGGHLSQTVMKLMRRPGRIVECGQISTYDDDAGSWMVDIKPIHGNGLRFEGFTPILFADKWPEAIADLSTWVADGRLDPIETEMTGLTSLPHALVSLLKGEGLGKMVVSIGE